MVNRSSATNSEVFPQEYDEDGCPVCCDCQNIYVNVGQGMACEACRARDLIECEHDYASGMWS